MLTPLRIWREWPRLREVVRMIARADDCSSDAIHLLYPKASWYADHAHEMLEILEETAARLERALGLTFLGRTTVHVTDPETALTIQGSEGAAYRTDVLIGFPARHLPAFAVVAAHELAHILALRLGRSGPRCKSEGFACYAAWLIGADRMPCGLPLHYHPAWLLSVGVRPRLEELWQRRDYTPEVYDLAWSFAVFLVQRFGRERYFAFYRSEIECLPTRVAATLGLALPRLEQEWHEHARGAVDLQAQPIRERDRYVGYLCSQAAWRREWNSWKRGRRG